MEGLIISKTESGTAKEVECKLCDDMGYILTRDNAGREYAEECTCQEKARLEQILRNSGIAEAFKRRNFNNFKTLDSKATEMKEKALQYVKEFDDTKSFFVAGIVGSGKSHITIAIANEFMNKGIAVRYAQYGDMVRELLSCRQDNTNYHTVANKYKNARVLLIDDLFKGAVTEWNGIKRLNSRDIEMLFDIINYRYMKQKPIIVSSEFLPQELLEFDEGIVSRIIEMSEGFVITITDKTMNRRI